MPTRNKDLHDPEDLSRATLARMISNLRSRCSKALDDHPRGRQLNQDEVEYFEWCLSDAVLLENENQDRIAENGDARHNREEKGLRAGIASDSKGTRSRDCPSSAAMATVVAEKISYDVRQRCDEILMWRREHGGRAPTHHKDDNRRAQRMRAK